MAKSKFERSSGVGVWLANPSNLPGAGTPMAVRTPPPPQHCPEGMIIRTLQFEPYHMQILKLSQRKECQFCLVAVAAYVHYEV